MQPVETNCLTGLDFSCCSINDDYKPCLFLKNIQCFTCLINFNVGGFMKFDKVVEDAAMFLLHNTQLKQLDISNLHLDLKNCRALTQSLIKHPNFTNLNISAIGDVCDEDIALILSNNINLEELDLSCLKPYNFSKIANSVKNFLHLKKLNISNDFVTADIIGDILSCNTNLEHLNLSLCLKIL